MNNTIYIDSRINIAYVKSTAAFIILVTAALLLSFRPSPHTDILKSKNKILLVIDPAHGGTDQGSHYGNYTEKDIDLKVALRIKALAAAHNIDVRLTREGDQCPAQDERVDFSNNLHPDYFISIHVGEDSSKDYEILIQKNTQLTKNIQFGSAIFRQLSPLLGAETGNIVMRTQGLHILRKNTAPAALLNIGSISNEAQMKALSNNDKLDELCDAILNAVVEARM